MRSQELGLTQLAAEIALCRELPDVRHEPLYLGAGEESPICYLIEPVHEAVPYCWPNDMIDRRTGLSLPGIMDALQAVYQLSTVSYQGVTKETGDWTLSNN